MTNVEQYLNTNKHTCVQLPKGVGEYLQVDKFLSEYEADEEKELVMQNILLLDSFPTEGSTRIVNSGDLFNIISGINNRIDSLNQSKAERQELQNLSQTIEQSVNQTINNLSDEISSNIQQSITDVRNYFDDQITLIRQSINGLPDNIQQQLDTKLDIDIYNQDKENFVTINDIGLNIQERPFEVLPGQLVKQEYKTITISDNKQHSVNFNVISLYKEWLPMNLNVNVEQNNFIVTNPTRIVYFDIIELYRESSPIVYTIPSRIVITRNNEELLDITELEEYYNGNSTWNQNKNIQVENLSTAEIGDYEYTITCYYEEDEQEKSISKSITVSIFEQPLNTYIYVNDSEDPGTVTADFLNSNNYVIRQIGKSDYVPGNEQRCILTISSNDNDSENVLQKQGYVYIIIPVEDFDDPGRPVTKQILMAINDPNLGINEMYDSRIDDIYNHSSRALTIDNHQYIWFVSQTAISDNYASDVNLLKFYIKSK